MNIKKMIRQVVIMITVLAIFILTTKLKTSGLNQSNEIPVLNESAVSDSYREDNYQEDIVIDFESIVLEVLNEYSVDATKIGIYIEDYTNSQTYGLNSHKNMVAASIYKVPLAMVYYDMIEQQEIQLNSLIPLQQQQLQLGGPVYEQFVVGDLIPLETLLYYLIVDSDNTAGHMLFENLGGWLAFKDQMLTYLSFDPDEVYFSNDNISTAKTNNDILRYLFSHQERYQQLIEHMNASQPNNYLNKFTHKITTQKYGMLLDSFNSVGIVFEPNPYSIVVLSELGETGIEVMGQINKRIYESYQSSVLQ